LNPRVHPALTATVARCIAPDPEGRFASIDELLLALDAIGRRPPLRMPGFGAIPTPDPEPDAASRVARFVETLQTCAYERGEGGCGWPATSGKMPNRGTPWLYEGDAGIVYALAELLHAPPLRE